MKAATLRSQMGRCRQEDEDGGEGDDGSGDGDNDYGTVVATAAAVRAGTVKGGRRPLISVPFPLHAKSLIDSINRQRRGVGG